MHGMPLDDVANSAVDIVEKMLVGRRQMPRRFRPHLFVAPAQHQCVEFEEEAQLTEREQVDLARDQSVDERVAGNHVVDRDVIEADRAGFPGAD